MENLKKKIFEINCQSNFDNIPTDTQKLVINSRYYNNSKNGIFLDNLPICLQEVHFNNIYYLFNNHSSQSDNSFSNDKYSVILLFKLKIPFGCKLYKLTTEVINFDGLIRISYKEKNPINNYMNFNFTIEEIALEYSKQFYKS